MRYVIFNLGLLPSLIPAFSPTSLAANGEAIKSTILRKQSMFFTNLQFPGKSLFPGYCDYLSWLRGHLKKKIKCPGPKAYQKHSKVLTILPKTVISGGANRNLIVNLKGNPGRINGHRKFWKFMRFLVHM